MEEIYTKIQIYLLKKDKECGKLKFLTSRTTTSNDAHVTEICDTIKSILEESKDDNREENIIQHFKFLLLNTNFRSQEYLCEDIANGHLVDMCPPLSPYLFFQILWAMKYDEIICNFILYIPMDLCSEIIESLRRCLDLDFSRSFDIGLKVVRNCYKKIISTIHRDVQVLEKEESLQRFSGSIQELLSSLSELPSKNIEGLSQLSKYERCGWVLIRLLNTIRDCVEMRKAEKDPLPSNNKLEKSHRVTFGRDFIVKLDQDAVSEALEFFTKELIDVLFVNVKKIDCFVYMGWAELDYAEDPSISTQRAVGLACYHFIKLFEADQSPEEYSHVLECLEQLSSRPDAPFSMSLKELCNEVDKGNKECLRKLIERFEEWDSIAISCFDKNKSLIEKDECLSLLNNALKFFEISSEEEFRIAVYSVVMKILMGQELFDMIKIVVEFILIHNASRELESSNFEANLTSYVNQGVSLCSGKTSLRVIYFFIIQNSREVLKTLIRAAIGYEKYENSLISPKDFCKLSPILQIRDSNNISLFSNALRIICTENKPWITKKFINLIRVLLDRNLISADELINDIFIPVLKNEIILANVQSILTCMRIIINYLTSKTKGLELLYVLALQMNFLRKKTDLSLNSQEEVLDLLIRVIQLYISNRETNLPINDGEDSILQKLEASLEPLDKIYFAPLWGWIKNDIGLDQILQDYKKRSLYVLSKSKSVKNCSAELEEFLETHGLENCDFLQHLILRCTEFEYIKLAKEALIIDWNCFNWENELEAYAQFSLATIEACNYCLESFDPNNSREFLAQKFSSLIKSLGKMTLWFINIDKVENYEFVYKSLIAAMNSLNLSTDIFPYLLRFHKDCDETPSFYSYETVAELANDVDKLGKLYLLEYNQPVSSTDSALQFDLKMKFISIFLSWPMDEHSLLLSKIDKKLYF